MLRQDLSYKNKQDEFMFIGVLVGGGRGRPKFIRDIGWPILSPRLWTYWHICSILCDISSRCLFSSCNSAYNILSRCYNAKINIFWNEWTMNVTEITGSASIRYRVVSSQGRSSGLALVLLARIWEMVGVVEESSVMSAIQYRLANGCRVAMLSIR